MDESLFRLVQEFSRDCVGTKPYDFDTLGLAYMKRAYELGKDARGIEPTETTEGIRMVTRVAARADRLPGNSQDC